MKKNTTIFIALLTLLGCSNPSNKKEVGRSQSAKNGVMTETNVNKFPITKLNTEDLRFIHTFINHSGEVLGKLYGKEIADSIYSDFLIVKEINGEFIPIYAIERSTFQNINGKENIPINSDTFYGYHVLVTVSDNMDIGTLFKVNGKILKGDPITVKWEESDKVFKVLLAP